MHNPRTLKDWKGLAKREKRRLINEYNAYLEAQEGERIEDSVEKKPEKVFLQFHKSHRKKYKPRKSTAVSRLFDFGPKCDAAELIANIAEVHNES